MSTRYLFVKRSRFLSRRLLMWGVPLLLFLALLLPSLQSALTDQDVSIWVAPIEPPGTIVVTQKTIPAKQQSSAAIQTAPSAATTPIQLKTTASLAPAENAHQVNEETSLREALNQWQQAWSSKNVASYLSFYGPDFSPKGVSRQSWESARHERIASKQKINIEVQNLRLQINTKTATTKFTQVYTDDRLRMTDRKTLVWQKHNGRWLIQSETTD